MLVKIKRDDGGVSIMETSAEDIDAVVAKWQQSFPEAAAEGWEIIEPESVPSDRTFRDAWGHDLQTNMPKARTVHMGRIRAARDRELARLDIEQLKGNDVAAAKQQLRDIPQTFDLSKADTPESLKVLWPDGLPK